MRSSKRELERRLSELEEKITLPIQERVDADVVAGNIILADDVGMAMRDWREKFNKTQPEIASQMNTTTSVISDYERGRRPSPGSGFVARFVRSLYE